LVFCGSHHQSFISKYTTSSSKSKVLSAHPHQCIMVSMLDSIAVYRGFEPQSGQTKNNKIDFYCFSAKHVAFRRKSKDWLTWNQNNMSKWNNMSTRGQLFQWASTIKIQLNVLYKAYIIIILCNATCSNHGWKIVHL